jgi:hypothetical protein
MSDARCQTTESAHYALQKHRQPANRAVLGGILSHVGFVIQDVADGGFMVIRADWGMSHYCHDIAELQAFARKVGVLNHG